MKNKMFKDIRPLLEQEFGAETAESILKLAEQKFDKLCADHADEPKAVKAQTHNNMYPCISLYWSLQEKGVEPPKALDFLDKSWSKMAEPKAASIRTLLKIPGLYKLMPAIFKFVTLKQFGETAGFQAKFYDMGKGRCKFDMTKCLFCDLCKKNGCPELVPCFCHTDDVTDGNMHPKLLWNRTKVMGEGGNVCDFDLIVKK